MALQRIQEPTNLDVRRLNAITRKLQKEPKKLIFPAMECQSNVGLHSVSGYRRLDGNQDEVKGYGMRGMSLIRRGKRRTKGQAKGCPSPPGTTDVSQDVVHLLDSVCKSHRLQIRSSYGAEIIAAAHGFDDAYPTLVTLHELKHGIFTPGQLKNLKERGGLCLYVTLTTDSESVLKSLTSRGLKTPTEKTLLGHVS